MKELEHVTCNTQSELKNWLAENYSSAQSVWLVYPKKSSGVGDMSWPLIVDELLCWGWVDSLPGKVDEVYTKIRISPRNPKSNWSKINKDKIDRLRQEGRMRASGEALVTTAQDNGCWEALNDVEALIVPSDMQKILDSKPQYQAEWNKLPKSSKRGLLEQLLSAKKPETRARKVRIFLEKMM